MGFTSRGAAQGFLLVVDDRRIPIQTLALANRQIEGQLCRVRSDIRVGESAFTAAFYDVPEYKFQTESDRQKVTRIALEALILFGRDTDGLDAPSGLYRVERGELLLRLEDVLAGD